MGVLAKAFPFTRVIILFIAVLVHAKGLYFAGGIVLANDIRHSTVTTSINLLRLTIFQ